MIKKPFSIEISEEAEIDLDKSYEYYYDDNPNVADSFINSINRGFDHIKQNPNSFPVAHKDVRKYVLKKFPFVIYYQIVDVVIRVIAIFHTSRNPETWNDRT